MYAKTIKMGPKVHKYTWEELLMQYVQYMLWYNTLPGGWHSKTAFPILRQQMVDKRFIQHSTQQSIRGAADGSFSVQYSQL